MRAFVRPKYPQPSHQRARSFFFKIVEKTVFFMRTFLRPKIPRDHMKGLHQ